MNHIVRKDERCGAGSFEEIEKGMKLTASVNALERYSTFTPFTGVLKGCVFRMCVFRWPRFNAVDA